MKQSGDVVLYVEKGVEFNALVLMSQPFEEGEHLALTFLTNPGTPLMTGTQQANAMRTVFGIKPLVDGMTIGWKDEVKSAVNEHPVVEPLTPSEQGLVAEGAIASGDLDPNALNKTPEEHTILVNTGDTVQDHQFTTAEEKSTEGIEAQHPAPAEQATGGEIVEVQQ